MAVGTSFIFSNVTQAAFQKAVQSIKLQTKCVMLRP